jgi:hypothetical protein
MIGNDVVDLGHRGVQPGAQHPRFDARVFSAEELAALERSAARERLRWMLWAAKEAAYKVAKKLDGAVVWAPARFHVELDSRLCGRVVNGALALGVRVQETRDWVHALAYDAGARAEAQHAGVGRLPSAGADASCAARAFACSELAGLLGRAPEALAVEKRGRIPVLSVGGAPAPADLSLSHHGRFVAYACELGGPAA